MGEAALQSLARAIELAEPGGYIRVFVDEGTPMRLLILDFRLRIEKQARVEARKLKGYADRLLSAFPQAGPTPKSTIRDLQSTILEPLSERELEVLRLLATDLSSTDIAQQLVVSTNTVRSHIKSIYGKLNVHQRHAALERAKELGLL